MSRARRPLCRWLGSADAREYVAREELSLLRLRREPPSRLHQTRIQALPPRVRDGVKARCSHHVQETILCPRAVPFIALAPAPQVGRVGSVRGRARVRGRRASFGRRVSVLHSGSKGHLPFIRRLCLKKTPFHSYPLTWERMRGGFCSPPSGGTCLGFWEGEERKRVATASVLVARRCPKDSPGWPQEARIVRESGWGSVFAAPARRSAHPLPASDSEKALGVERDTSFQHEIDGAAELGGQHAERLVSAVLLMQSAKKPLKIPIAVGEEYRGFRESPTEIGIPHRSASRGFDLTIGIVPAWHQATVRKEDTDLGEASDVVNLVEEGQCQNIAYSGNRTERRVGHPVIGAKHSTR